MKRVVVLLYITVMIAFVISCNRQEELNKNEEQSTIHVEERAPIMPIHQEETTLNGKTKEENIVLDLDRFFIDENWHPLKQTEYIQELKKRLAEKEKEDVDESLYEDEFTTEFSLHDETRNFCLYHNIRKVENFDMTDFEIYSYNRLSHGVLNGLEIVKCFIEKNKISVLWNDNTGAILIMATDDPMYSTKRGIRIGDSAEKIMLAYESDCKVEEYNYVEDKWVLLSEKDYPCMTLSKSNECISLNAGNPTDEEVMTLSYLLKDGMVTKIVIQCGS